MADGKVVIETDLDSSGIEKGIKETQKSLKSQAASLAAEYKKQGMSASDAFKKAWSEIERSSGVSADAVEKDWKNSSTNISSAISKIGSITAKGLKVAATAVAGTATALGGVAAAAVKVGSDFEAQMSRVKAISGATGEEFEQLRQQAIDLGADTAFSASQAAQGMENLAAAGFTTNEIMIAMPGMLDLAAASGEDLAASADIAASTLRGFGLEASEAGHVADVLAENANRTNSSVAETGEAMKYIAPLARAAGISMEETAAAIGIMANAGIQGSQAGTTLRGALSRLSKPTDIMQQAMDELGVSFYDSEGKMLSLAEQVGMLQNAMEGMTDEQKNNYLVTLYGQEALSGMLALINEGPESLSSLTSAYESCDGAAQTAATTMQDNLKGAIEQLSGSAETLGIVFYDSVADSMKNAAQAATDSVNNITEAFNNGGLDAAISAAGDEFANLATEAASHAPEMVDVAVDFIQSFADGVARNRKRLIGAAGEAAEAIASGLADLLPSELREPVEDAIDAISDSLSSGGLKKAGETAVNTLENVVDIVGKLADVALPLLTDALDFASENLDVVAAAAAAAFTAFKGYTVVTTASKAAQALAATTEMLSAAEKANALQVLAASGALTAKEMIIGVLTGKITLATAAQTAWNAVMNANPIGLLITAIGALAAGIGVYVLTQKDAETATDRANKKLAEQAEAIREAQAARQEEVSGIEAEYGYYQQLWNELQGIVDQNGKVKEGYEERASFIASTLSDSLGVEIDLTDGVIQKYGELAESIDQVIAKKKAEAIMDAYKDDYTEAIKNQSEAAKELSRTYDDYSAAQERAKEAADALEEAQSSMTAEQAAGSFEIMQLQQAQMDANEELEKAKTAYDDAKTASEEYGTTIANYESAMGAVESGSENASAAVLALSDNLKRAGAASEESLREQVEALGDSYDDMRAAAAEKGSGVTDEMVNQARAMWLLAQIEYEKGTTNNEALIQQWQSEVNELLSNSGGPEAAAQEGKEISQSHADGITSKKSTVSSAASAVSAAANAALSSADTGTTGKKAGDKYASGVSSKTGTARSAGKRLASSADSGAKSKTGYEAGSGFGSGFVAGIKAWVGSAVASAANLAASALLSAKKEINSNSPAKETIKLGKYFGQGFSVGIEGEIKNAEKSSGKLADAALQSLDMRDISNRMLESMAFNTNRVAKSFAVEASGKIISRQQTENLMRLSDTDIERLAARMGKVTADEMDKKQSNRPIYLGTDRIDKPLPKGAVPRI